MSKGQGVREEATEEGRAGPDRGGSSWSVARSLGGMECAWRALDKRWFAFWKMTLADFREWIAGARVGQRDEPKGSGAPSGDCQAPG